MDPALSWTHRARFRWIVADRMVGETRAAPKLGRAVKFRHDVSPSSGRDSSIGSKIGRWNTLFASPIPMYSWILACLSAQVAFAEPAGDALVIEQVSVIPMDRAEVLPDQTVVVRGGVIAQVGPAGAATLPSDSRHIDGRGRFLMPGLADMHVHVWDENDLYLFVANGVTTVRNMFGAPLHLDWRARIERGELVGPRIYTAGPIIDGKPAVWPGSVELDDPEEAAGVVEEQKAAGYDFLKPYARLTPECYAALVAAGEEQGMLLMGHVPEALGLR